MSNNIRVLLVDDDKAFREPMAEWLRHKGYVIDAVSNGHDAIEHVHQMKGQYDAALLDQTLVDGPDGIETMQRIHLEYPDLFVIIITGWGDREVGVRALREGAYRYIAKPGDPEEIDILIQSIAEMKEIQRKLELTKKEKEWLLTLLDVTQSIQSRIGDLKNVLDLIGEAAQRLTKANDWAIYVTDPLRTKLELYSSAASNKEKWNADLREEFIRISSLILSQNPLLYIQNTEEEQLIQPIVHQAGFRSLLGVAIGKVVLYACGQTPSQFGAQDTQILKMLASQADVAIQNALLSGERVQRINELEQLRQVGTLMAEAVELPEVLHRIAEGVKSLLEADSAAIWPYDTSRQKFDIERVAMVGIPDEEFKMAKQEPRSGGTAASIMEKGILFVKNVENPIHTFIGTSSRNFFLRAGIKSFAGVSLKVGAEPVGVLYLNYNQVCSFSIEEEATLKAFAAEASLAIKKARLYQQVQQTLQHLEVTADFMRLGDIKEVLRAVAKGVKEALNCDAVTLYRYDESKRMIVGLPVTHGLNDEKNARILQHVEPGTTVDSILQLGEHYADDAPSDSIMRGEFIPHEKIYSSAGIALRVGEHTVGILFVNYRATHHFTEEEKRLVRTFAVQAVIAIYNAELYEKEKKRSEHFRCLYGAGQVISASVDKDDILNELLDKALEITAISGQKAIYANILTYDCDTDEMIFTHAQPEGVLPKLQAEIGQRISFDDGFNGKIGIIGRTIKTRRTQRVGDVRKDADYISFHPDTLSEIAVPLIAGQRVIGVLNVEHPEKEGLDEQDRKAIEMLATQAVFAIQKAEHIEELRKTQSQLAARTAVALMGMASSTWRHEINKSAAKIFDNLYLIRKTLQQEALKSRRVLLGEKKDDIEEYLRNIERQAELIKETQITAPLTVKEGAESMRVNDLLLERIGRVLEAREATKEVEVKFIFNLHDEARIRVSREWLRRAIDILMQNALDAMKETSTKLLTVKTEQVNGRVEIRITDSGKGIPQEMLARLLKEPIPKKEGERGFGMGLLLAQFIAQTYNGDIRILSTGPQGTEMALYLPLESN